MATDKRQLKIRLSPEIYDKLKYYHKKTARLRTSTGNRLTFSSWTEELLADYIREQDKMIRVLKGMVGEKDVDFD